MLHDAGLTNINSEMSLFRLSNMTKTYKQIFFLALLIVSTGAAHALPSLQLGGDTSSPFWNYDATTQTWVASGANTFDLLAYANCLSGTAGCTNPNGDFAWDAAGAADRYAYLTVATMPDIGFIDGFDISISGASLVDSGYGAPPIQDPNSMSPHSIFDTYFEVYEFKFDGPISTIHNTQPGDTGSGSGYVESFGITINSLLDGVTAVHFDLFTVTGDRWDPSNTDTDKKLVSSIAPYSHDAEWIDVPEPGVLALLTVGLIGISLRKLSKSS